MCFWICYPSHRYSIKSWNFSKFPALARLFLDFSTTICSLDILYPKPTTFLVGGLAFGDDFSVPVGDGVTWGGFASWTESDEGGLRKIVHWGQKCPLNSKIGANFCVFFFKHQNLLYCTSYPKMFQNKHVLCSISKLSTSFWTIIHLY